jgi:hypothetical protein
MNQAEKLVHHQIRPLKPAVDVASRALLWQRQTGLAMWVGLRAWGARRRRMSLVQRPKFPQVRAIGSASTA